MNSLTEIKNAYAIEQGYEDWEHIQRITAYEGFGMEYYMNEICIRAQKAYGENLLKSAGYNYWINPEEITNEQNLIL